MTAAELDNKGCKVFGRSTVQYVVLKVCTFYRQYSSIAQSVEHAAVNRAVVGSSPTRGVWLLGQVVKTPPFHGGNMGSNPVGVTCGVVAKW